MSEYKPTQITGYITGLKSMSNHWRITIDSMDKIKPEIISYFSDVMNKPSWISVHSSQIENEHIVSLPPIETKEKKTKSKKLREALWVLWDNKWSDKYDNFQEFYDMCMDKLIQDTLNKVDE